MRALTRANPPSGRAARRALQDGLKDLEQRLRQSGTLPKVEHGEAERRGQTFIG